MRGTGYAVLLWRIRNRARLVARPVICDADGLPVPAGGADGERICERVVRLSAQLNSDARTVDGAVEIDLRSA